jgi:hypothetical protein
VAATPADLSPRLGTLEDDDRLIGIIPGVSTLAFGLQFAHQDDGPIPHRTTQGDTDVHETALRAAAGT